MNIYQYSYSPLYSTNVAPDARIAAISHYHSRITFRAPIRDEISTLLYRSGWTAHGMERRLHVDQDMLMVEGMAFSFPTIPPVFISLSKFNSQSREAI